MSATKIIAITAFCGIGAIAAYEYVQYAHLKSGLDAAFKKAPKFAVTNIGWPKFYADVIFTAHNSGALSAYLTDQQYDVYLNSNLVAQVKGLKKNSIGQSEFVPIHSKSVNGGISQIPINIEFSIDDPIKAALQNLSVLIDKNSWDRAIVTINGYFKFKSGLLTGTVPLKVSFSLADVVKK